MTQPSIEQRIELLKKAVKKGEDAFIEQGEQLYFIKKEKGIAGVAWNNYVEEELGMSKATANERIRLYESISSFPEDERPSFQQAKALGGVGSMKGDEKRKNEVWFF